VIDFTSALYLGFRHASHELQPWTHFTTGVPAALESPAVARQLAADFAQLQRCEAGTFATSTLHVFWDLFGVIADSYSAIYVDRGTYPIAAWGVERIAARGGLVRWFGHHDTHSLRRELRKGFSGRRPIIVADGFCPSCGRGSPIEQYLALAHEHGGYLVLDDTQALGIFGTSPSLAAPYGKGGGGMLRRANVAGPEVVLVSSLAKAFGVPLAILSGSTEIVKRFEALSETRMHCSPPSVATLRAADNAFRKNREAGDDTRFRLAQLVAFFQNRIGSMGLATSRTLFPVQTITPTPAITVLDLHEQLAQRGIRSVLHHQRHNGSPALSFLLNVRHTFEEIERTVEALHEILWRLRQPSFVSR